MQPCERHSPFLSVITINRNNAAELKNTIESVLSQDGIASGDLEYIIIDGNSNDGSVDVIKEYAARTDFAHKIAHWISEKDTGIYNAMNKGIRAAHGKYVALLNSGDCYIKGALTGLKEIADEHNGAILYGSLNFVRGGVFTFSSGCSADDLPRRMIPHPASFVPKKVYDDYGLYDENLKILADWDLFAAFKQKGVMFFYLSKIIADFDIRGVSSTEKKSERYREEFAFISGKYGFAKKTKKTLLKRIWKVLKMFIPYGLMLMVWEMQRRRDKKRRA